MTSDDWVVLAQHVQQCAWVPIDAAGADLLALEEALRDHKIEAAFLPYRPGESGGFTESQLQPLQLLVKAADQACAREIAVAVLGTDCDLIV